MTNEDGQIIVQDLRPMSEAPEDIEILVMGKYRTEFLTVFKIKGRVYNERLQHESVDDFLGWITMPIYKPKETPSCQDAINMGLKA